LVFHTKGITYTVWVFENRVLKGTYGLKRQGVTGGRGKLYNEELYICRPVPEIKENVTGGAGEFF
jgi:hypothetical protein